MFARTRIGGRLPRITPARGYSLPWLVDSVSFALRSPGTSSSVLSSNSRFPRPRSRNGSFGLSIGADGTGSDALRGWRSAGCRSRDFIMPPLPARVRHSGSDGPTIPALRVAPQPSPQALDTNSPSLCPAGCLRTTPRFPGIAQSLLQLDDSFASSSPSNNSSFPLAATGYKPAWSGPLNPPTFALWSQGDTGRPTAKLRYCPRVAATIVTFPLPGYK